MNSLTNRVLVLDADMIPCLSIVRSLARNHIICDIAAAVDFKTLTQYSRYSGRYFKYPDPLTEPENFVDFIAAHLQQYKYDLVIPVTERSLVPLAVTKKLAQWTDILAIAPRDGLSQVLDKTKTIELAKQCGVPVPFSFAVSSIEEVEQLTGKLDFPVVLKPGRSIANIDMRRHLSVTYAFNESELNSLSTDLLKHCELLLQQYTQGVGTGIELLADNGRIIYAFQHERVHELPLTGGGSCLRKSVAVDSALLNAATRLIEALNWHGVAMVEFKWNPKTGQYWLMEINGRFWGSLPLACAAGADFPLMLYKLLVRHERPASTAYKQNIYCRKLSADIYWYEQVLRRTGDPRLVSYPDKKQLVADALLALHPLRHSFDVQQWRDPAPGIVDLAHTLKEYYIRFSKLLYIKRLNKKHRSLLMQKRMQQQLQQAKTILFVCYGNINRSALAHVLADEIIASDKVSFKSAGFHPVCNRSADPNMVAIAAEQNINLAKCRSVTVNKAMIEQNDLIFVMEIEQLLRLKTEFPDAANKIFLLGTLISNKLDLLEIADPYGKDIDFYKSCFNTIHLAIKQLSDALVKTRPAQ